MHTEGKSRIAIVTGSARGIGKAIALALAAKGISPVIVDIDGEAARETANEIRRLDIDSAAYAADISSVTQINATFTSVAERFGSIDILVNNAGVLSTTAVMDITEDEWDRVMNINIKGAAFATQAALRYMIPNKWGRIINISSLSGRMGGYSTGVAYAVSKAAMIGLTYRTARRTAEYGITVNAIAPGPADTEMVEGFTPDQRKALEAGVPVGELIGPDSIAQTAAFLASEAAKFITGAVVDVNGGMFMG